MFRLIVAAACLFATNNSLSAAEPSYTKDVKPFIQKYCLDCHAAQKPKAGINLESVVAMFAPVKKGPAVVAGQPDKSLLMLTMTGGAKMMPPKKFPQKPTQDEIAVVRAWIAAGAKDDSPKPKK